MPRGMAQGSQKLPVSGSQLWLKAWSWMPAMKMPTKAIVSVQCATSLCSRTACHSTPSDKAPSTISKG